MMANGTYKNNAVPSYVHELIDDCRFTAEGEVVFLSEEGEKSDIVVSAEATPTTMASYVLEDGRAVPVKVAGGISATNLDKPGMPSTVMGPSSTNFSEPAPFRQPPQKTNHVSFATYRRDRAPKTQKSRRMSAEKQNGRGGRDREQAKRSRARKKLLVESLQKSVQQFKEENEKLKATLKLHLGEEAANEILARYKSPRTEDAGKLDENTLDETDSNFIKALETAQHNFCVTDPSLPDNPIVYATQGFLNLTGYTLDQVVGRNCRFLQGPETDPAASNKIREAIASGEDMSVCLLNYRADGTTFWNQFFIAALRDAEGNIVNYVGVQSKVSDDYAATVCKEQKGFNQ